MVFENGRKIKLMRKLEVTFGDPEYGWIEISIHDSIDTVTNDADSSWCSFCALITALVGMMKDSAEYSVFWMEEPEETTWRFVKHAGTVLFESRTSASDSVFQIRGSYEEVCLPFWRALQSLKGRYTKEELDERLLDFFPHDELELLTLWIEDLKDCESEA